MQLGITLFILFTLGISTISAEPCCEGVGFGLQPGHIPDPPESCTNTSTFTVYRNTSCSNRCIIHYCPVKTCQDNYINNCTMSIYSTCNMNYPDDWYNQNCKLFYYASSMRKIPHIYGITILLTLTLILNSYHHNYFSSEC